MSLAETATNVVRVVARCATTDGGKWVVSRGVEGECEARMRVLWSYKIS
jgi:hypothetical protein